MQAVWIIFCKTSAILCARGNLFLCGFVLLSVFLSLRSPFSLFVASFSFQSFRRFVLLSVFSSLRSPFSLFVASFSFQSFCCFVLLSVFLSLRSPFSLFVAIEIWRASLYLLSLYSFVYHNTASFNNVSITTNDHKVTHRSIESYCFMFHISVSILTFYPCPKFWL